MGYPKTNEDNQHEHTRTHAGLGAHEGREAPNGGSLRAREIKPSPSGDEPIDVQRIMASIRERLAKECGAEKERVPFRPAVADLESRSGSQSKAADLLQSEELRALNLGYAFSQKLDPGAITSHRTGLLGWVVLKAKRLVLTMLRDSIMKDYFIAEREFQANMVRFLNHTARHIGERDASIFWELIRKIDTDITKALRRIEEVSDEGQATVRSAERTLRDEVYGALRHIQEQLTGLQAVSEQQGVAIDTVSSVARGVESLLCLAHARQGVKQPEHDLVRDEGTTIEIPPFDPRYVLLENRFRGDPTEIRRRLAIYPTIVRDSAIQPCPEAPILEIGAGRGELQLLLREAGLPSYGIDLDPAMIHEAITRGVDVREQEAIAHLQSLPDNSLSGIIAVQVVEHLTRRQCETLCTLAFRKIKPGGVLIFETINPRSVLALSSNYFRDPTHVFPQHPDTLSFQVECAGFEVKEVRMLSPVPEGAKLKALPRQEFFTPRWDEFVTLMNHNVRVLNELLYGHQDYCVVAERRVQVGA